ncbi:uncharacterized protein LOC126657244 [Mercurialis annua]|uniref:uncharacterized protein LOC126657244 n=1 Tax=Mercurialis annua TaxID=3986 RepID=UPI00215DE532|nr:uncharacterized protein LOC126657244 [Mercurialis annua]
MEPVKTQKLIKFNNFQFLQLPTKLFSLIILFSLLLVCSSLLPILFNFMQIFSCKLGKNYMFLLCNGILVLIVKNSGLMGSSDLEIKPVKKNGEFLQKSIELSPSSSSEIKNRTVFAEEKVAMQVQENQETEEKCLVAEKVEDQETEEQEEIELLSAEELNKKCDDFIREMRKQLSIS